VWKALFWTLSRYSRTLRHRSRSLVRSSRFAPAAYSPQHSLEKVSKAPESAETRLAADQENTGAEHFCAAQFAVETQ
jgi:hypothetical protein